MHRFLLHNEEIHETTDRCLMAGQAGLLTGWGVFSTLRVMDGVLFEWPRHFARMQHDAELLGVPMPEAQHLERQLYRLVAANQAGESTLRVAVVRNTGGPFDSPRQQRACDVIAFTKDLAQWGQSTRLGLVEQARHAANRFCAAKMLAWSMNLRWYELARQQGLDEVVLLNERGEVAELTSANILAVYGQEIVTPPLTSGCLPGITRQVLLEIPVPGYRVREQVLKPQDLQQADEVFITSSTRETLPVSEIQGLQIRFVPPHGGPGRLAAQKALADYMTDYAERHKLAGSLNS
jgi:branched-chain amino acid aminotransferase